MIKWVIIGVLVYGGLRSDINQEGRVDMLDLAIMAEEWLLEESEFNMHSEEKVPAFSEFTLGDGFTLGKGDDAGKLQFNFDSESNSEASVSLDLLEGHIAYLVVVVGGVFLYDGDGFYIQVDGGNGGNLVLTEVGTFTQQFIVGKDCTLRIIADQPLEGDEVCIDSISLKLEVPQYTGRCLEPEGTNNDPGIVLQLKGELRGGKKHLELLANSKQKPMEKGMKGYIKGAVK